MRKLAVFNSVSLDGYFTGVDGDLSWAHGATDDKEWGEFVAGNAQSGGTLLMGRITYQMMASYWPTPMAMQNDPVVAKHMNELEKIVFSRTLDSATWSNTKLMKGDLAAEMRKLKSEPGPDIVILGSGSIIAPLIAEGLVDEVQMVIVPVALGAGRTMFEGIPAKVPMKLVNTRAFKNGNVVLSYDLAKVSSSQP